MLKCKSVFELLHNAVITVIKCHNYTIGFFIKKRFYLYALESSNQPYKSIFHAEVPGILGGVSVVSNETLFWIMIMSINNLAN